MGKIRRRTIPPETNRTYRSLTIEEKPPALATMKRATAGVARVTGKDRRRVVPSAGDDWDLSGIAYCFRRGIEQQSTNTHTSVTRVHHEIDSF